jgi:hypothetical protein
VRFNRSQKTDGEVGKQTTLADAPVRGRILREFRVKKGLRPIKTDSHSSPTFRSASGNGRFGSKSAIRRSQANNRSWRDSEIFVDFTPFFLASGIQEAARVAYSRQQQNYYHLSASDLLAPVHRAGKRGQR